MIVTETIETWIEPSEIRALFKEDTYSKPVEAEVELDDELGLPIVQKQTMEKKYNLGKVKDNDFTRSLREQFERKGYLSPKQVACLRK